MSVIIGILEDELKRLEELSSFYKQKIAEMQKGSISIKERAGKKYLYLARRENKKVVFQYAGKDSPEIRNPLLEKVYQRKEYQSKLKQVQANLNEVKRALRGKRA
jgi:hypothetical protein